jgi:hypothetical protein
MFFAFTKKEALKEKERRNEKIGEFLLKEKLKFEMDKQKMLILATTLDDIRKRNELVKMLLQLSNLNTKIKRREAVDEKQKRNVHMIEIDLLSIEKCEVEKFKRKRIDWFELKTKEVWLKRLSGINDCLEDKWKLWLKTILMKKLEKLEEEDDIFKTVEKVIRIIKIKATMDNCIS